MIENFISWWWWPFCYFSRGIPIEFKTFFFYPGVYCSGSILVQAAGAHETIDNALGERKRRKSFFFLRSRESFLLLLFSRDFAGAMWTRIIRHVDCRSA